MLKRHSKEIFNYVLLELNDINKVFDPQNIESVNKKQKINKSLLELSLKFDKFNNSIEKIQNEQNFEIWQYDLNKNCEILRKMNEIFPSQWKRVTFQHPFKIKSLESEKLVKVKNKRKKFFKFF